KTAPSRSRLCNVFMLLSRARKQGVFRDFYHGLLAARLFACIALLFLLAFLSWQAVRRAPGGAILPHNANYHFRLAANNTQPIAHLQRALALNPRLTSAWIALGLQQETDGDPAGAEHSLLRAAAIDKTFAPAWALANFYLRQNRMAEFWTWAGTAAHVRYAGLDGLFALCWRAAQDPAEILNVLPDRLPVRRQYLAFLARQGRLDVIEDLAVDTATRGDATDAGALVELCERLLASGRHRAAVRLWNAMAQGGVIVYEAVDPSRILINGALDHRPLGKAFDWRPYNGAAVSWNWRPSEVSVALSGKQPDVVELASQSVMLAAGVAYRFAFEFRTDQVQPESGVRWTLMNPRTGADLIPDGRLAGGGSSGQWKREAITVPPPLEGGLHRLVLLHRRASGSVRTQGTVFLRALVLERAA
ncbi:MAG: hypothetical protein ACRD8O_01000, partial [Bryobacteraceae bacterium]